MVISGGNTLTITWSDFVSSHTNVCTWFEASSAITNKLTPGEGFSVTFTVSGKTYVFSGTAGECPNCSGPVPDNAQGKWGNYNGQVVTFQSHKVSTENEVLTFTDTLTSGSQSFKCDSLVNSYNYYTSRSTWGDAADATSKGMIVEVISCSPTKAVV